MHHEITLADVAELTGGDGLCMWAAQAGARAWAAEDGSAVAVAGPSLACRDRLAVHGDPAALVALVSAVLDEVGPTYRPLGEPETIRLLADRIPALAVAGTFGWMERGAEGPVAPRGDRARWLAPHADAEIADLVEAGFPDSHARPGTPGVTRWAGIRDARGSLAAVAADAWSAPDVALLSGVTVRPEARGTGLGAAVCAFVVAELLDAHGRVALMVESDNAPARRTYEALGLRFRPLAAAAVA
ncbi:GNAT family N-acetyltransferase [Yinghuangia soli]|uniref:GNAT family N-acetyltransferase n=1 Tax=Yinghuangia soli TaxID=2908204 RepID=A0AA41Q3S1_9ACTN|nr:GNAT family N-acetyltransferase [Yinghuangia soli]MCF2531008.1 GNAT family N-acetyltransferase [Yinghuangia soli]